MNNFRYRPKDNFIQEADWKELFVLTEHWKSDLLFFADDIKFLHDLIDKYYLWIARKEHIDKVQEIEINLLNVDRQNALLLKKTNKHLEHLEALIDNPFKYDAYEFRNEHEQLEDDLSDFLKSFRKNRKEVFSITEFIIDKEELVRHLDFSKIKNYA
ncbi:hypothetical protein FF125_08910 [Aureibaculum algae]|uniref:Uncharacterized protein n=1 Tax=Aureibaculum algae TaxID=2584122 RepID=A0A5B7TTL3_9FLAO|nr:hypothetical protein [Aureibaculum algae]QCX38544.1 hypothetical protein FF125_08910 [Aureibaculum algae]